jgi:biopolymer transport protein ExbD
MTTRRKPEAGPEPNLPVTPMLDMAFQLLAFFVMTYHPSDLEGHMELSLPSENISKANSAEEVKTDAAVDKEKPVDLPVSLTVIVRTQRDNVNTGSISGITLQEDTGSHPVETLDKLRDELKTRRAEVANKENIKIQADAKLKWSEVVQVMDVCKQAGFTNISFAPPPG